MNLAVFGGTGDTGLLVIKKALDKGCWVTAFARKPSKIPFPHDHLKIVRGELNDIEGLDSVIKAADAVISILGPIGRTTGLPAADGAGKIIASMQGRFMKGLIASATTAVRVRKASRRRWHRSYRFLVDEVNLQPSIWRIHA